MKFIVAPIIFLHVMIFIGLTSLSKKFQDKYPFISSILDLMSWVFLFCGLPFIMMAFEYLLEVQLN